MTAVFGNVTVDIAARNAKVLAERVRQPHIPVAKGLDVPRVMIPNGVSHYVHGAEGFGAMEAQQHEGKLLDETAAEFIVRMVNAHPHEITLCPIGPLTNIAAALDLDPTIAAKCKAVVIMGGGLDKGNVTEHAEANIWNDPHAADVVFAAPWEVTVVGLDVTTKVTCSAQDFASLADRAPILGGFLNEAAQFYLKFYKDRYGLDGSQFHDAMAVIAITNPEFFGTELHKVEVVVEGEQIGKTSRSQCSKRTPAKVCMSVDGERTKRLFLNTISESF